MATPKLVSLIASQSSALATTKSSPYTQQLPEPSKAGNLLLAWVFTGAPGPTMATTAVVDDKSQTWTRVLNGVGGTNTAGWLFKMENTVADVRKVTFTIGGTIPGGVSIIMIEVFNVLASAATGLTWSKEDTAGVSAIWDSGANQTPTAGSSIYHFATAANTGFLNLVNPSTAGTNYQMEADDILQGIYVGQSWEGVTATSHSPTVTVGASGSWLSMAIEVKAGTGGADGPAFRVKRAFGMNFHQVTATTHNYHVPCDGNLILVDTSSGNDPTPSLISSISGATYTQHGASPLNGGAAGGYVQHFHADNVTPSRTAVNGVITFATAPSGGSGGGLWFRDIIGADIDPLDTGATGSGGLSGSNGALSGTGTQLTAGSLDVGTVTPSPGKRLVTAYTDDASGSDIGMDDVTVNFLIPYANGDGGSGDAYALDSGLASKIVTGAQNFTFTRSATAAGPWEVLAASYKAAPPPLNDTAAFPYWPSRLGA